MMSPRSFGLAALLAAGTSLAQPRPPPRQPPAPPTAPAAAVDPAVEAEHTRGIELRRQGRDAEAREVFRALYERTHEPRALARQAAAEAAIGDWLAAEAHLADALSHADDAWIAQQRAGLEADLQGFREHLGLLEISTATPGATVWIGGAQVAALPLEHPLRVRAGTVAVELRADGYLPEVRSVDVPRGMRVPAREVIQLTPIPRGPRVSVGPVVPEVVQPPPLVREAQRVPPTRIAGIALLVAGAVGLGVGVAGFALREGTVSDFNDDRTCGTNALTGACRALYDRGTTELTLGVVGLSLGGALAVGGATLMGLSFRRAAVAPTAVAGGAGLVVAGQF
jgi:hypothetical protein